MPEISLANLSMILGVMALAKGVYFITAGKKAREMIKAFPRNDNAGYLLILISMVWFLLILKDENMADFEKYRTAFNVFILAAGIGSCLYLKDYLAVRGAAVLMMLIAKLIVHRPSRDECIVSMRRALNEFIVEGVKTTIPLYQNIFGHTRFIRGLVNTTFIEEVVAP